MQSSHSALAFAGATAPHGLPFVYLSAKAVAEAIGRSVPTLYKLIASRKFPQGDLIDTNTRRWRSDVVARWLEETAAKAEAEREHADAHIKRRAQASIVARQNRVLAARGAQ
jgi:predicted DNA-binding transcriptional regulator AlpA